SWRNPHVYMPSVRLGQPGCPRPRAPVKVALLFGAEGAAATPAGNPLGVVRVKRVGEPLHDPVMFVANHGSWMDITVLHAIRPADFVAKAEIGHWPLVGWMARRGGTIFHQRGSTDSLAQVMAVMSDRLRTGRSIAAFPEGGTAPAGTLKIFHARILQAALDASAPVQPVALRYLRNGKPAPDMLFTRGESFLHNVGRVLATRSLTAEVHFLQPVVFDAQGGRRRMAETARAEIAQVLGIPAWR